MELDNAVEFIAADKPTASTDVALKIWEPSKMIARQPGMGRPGRVPGTCELVIPDLSYILPYTEK